MARETQIHSPLFLGTMSAPHTSLAEMRGIANPSPASLTWVTNLAVYVPFWIAAPYPVQRLWWINGSSVTANVDVGVYSAGGSLLVNAGTTAQSGASAPQYVSKAIILPAGRYYFAIACSSTTNKLFGSTALTANTLRFGGVLQQALSALPLPATMTPAVISNALFPVCGITQSASGF